MAGFRINPNPHDLLVENSVVTGRNWRYRTQPIEGTLSIKTMLAGNAAWTTNEGSYEVSPETCLVLNDRQTYSLEIDSIDTVHTFCVFFRPGFVEDAYRSRGLQGQIGFFERLRLTPDSLASSMRTLKLLADEGTTTGLEADEALTDAALALVGSETGHKERAELEVVHAATREEVFRQLNRARDYALSNVGSRLSLDELSGIACMSPFHFHRLHRQAFHETPHEFVTRARLTRAKRLLHADSAIAEVAGELGFESTPTFARLFKTHIGMTPGAFRKIG